MDLDFLANLIYFILLLGLDNSSQSGWGGKTPGKVGSYKGSSSPFLIFSILSSYSLIFYFNNSS